MDVWPMSLSELFVVECAHYCPTKCPTNFKFVVFVISIRVEVMSVNDKLKFVGHFPSVVNSFHKPHAAAQLAIDAIENL